MKSSAFQKLNINLSRQPLSNQRRWLIAGLLFAIIILLFTAYSYFAHKKYSTFPDQPKKIRCKKHEHG
jgi:hypothetical protein